MRRIIDISMPLGPGMVRWPGSTKFQFEWTSLIWHGDAVNNSSICMDSHCGTHVDAPLHHFNGRESIDKIPLGILIGPAFVVDFSGVRYITKEKLEASSIPRTVERVLFKTDNSTVKTKKRFNKEFVALSPEAAKWLVHHGIRLAGIDYLSIQRYNSSDATHKILLEANVVIIEGINLHSVREGLYDLVCLPLRMVGLEGAPARAILIEYSVESDE